MKCEGQNGCAKGNGKGKRKRKRKRKGREGSRLTLRVPRLTSVNTPPEGRFVFEHGLALERDPVATEGAVAGMIFCGNEGRQQLELLNEGAVWFSFEIGELFDGAYVRTEGFCL